jgi:hypothetical protein
MKPRTHLRRGFGGQVVSRETPSKRHGKRWSEKEIATATDNRKAGQDIPSLAKLLTRTEDAVEAKLRRLRILLQPHRKHRYVIPARRRRVDREAA